MKSTSSLNVPNICVKYRLYHVRNMPPRVLLNIIVYCLLSISNCIASSYHFLANELHLFSIMQYHLLIFITADHEVGKSKTI